MRDWREYVRQHLVLPEIKAQRERQAVEELASQLEEAYDEALEAGRSEEDADACARAHFGDWDEVAKEISRAVKTGRRSPLTGWVAHSEEALRAKGRPGPSLADAIRGVRLTVRRLARAPGFTVVVLASLALGIGANTAIFSLANGILLRPLSYDESERLVSVRTMLPNVGINVFSQSAALHFTYEDDSATIESLGMWLRRTVIVSGLNQATNEAAASVTHGVFPTLRARPALGRAFTPADDTPGATPTAIISHGYWQTQFAGAPGILGETIRVDGVVHEVIGVMPQGFRLVGYDLAMYLPFQLDRARTQAGAFRYQSVGRLAAGFTTEDAVGELASLIPVSIERFPGGMTLDNIDEWGLAPLLRPLKRELTGDVGNILWILLGSAGMVLLIVCANVANLSLVRAEGLQHEMAVRTAIGASRLQLAAHFVMEGAILALVGGLLGLGVATASLRLLRDLGTTSLPRLYEVGLDPVVLLFTLGVSVATGLACGLFPMLRSGRSSVAGALREGMGRAGTRKERHRTRHALVVSQIATALVLLVGSGLMIRTFENMRDVDPGFGEPETILTLLLQVPAGEIADLEEMVRTHELIAERLAELPGVAAVGLTSKLPLGPGASNGPGWMADFPVPEGAPPPARRSQFVDGDYFEVMQIPIVAGRALSRADAQDRRAVVVISEGLAREYWDSPADALGRRLSAGDLPGENGWREIVGVAADVRDRGVAIQAPTIIYWPMITPHPWPDANSGALYASRSMFYAIRTDRAFTAELTDEVRAVISGINPRLAVSRVQTMALSLSNSMKQTSFTLVMLGVASAIALLLGSIGVYGVIAYVVSQRTREIGLRMALGARPRAVQIMVLRQGFILAGIGICVGLVVAFAATRLMDSVLFGVSPTDPTTIALVSAGLLLVIMLASYIPSMRAASVDPVIALRGFSGRRQPPV